MNYSIKIVDSQDIFTRLNRFITGASNRIFLKITMMFLLTVSTLIAQPFEIVVPQIKGIEVTAGESVRITTPNPVKTALAFQFNDGRIVVGNGENSMWSYDKGYTWEPGPASPGEKVAIDLGGGEILSIGRNSKRRPDGKFTLRQRRSLDNWESVKTEQADLDIPQASFTVTGSGGRVDGFLFHHGILRLENGDLIGTMYGNYYGDVQLCDGYPPELNQRKYRTVVVFSKDKGHIWGNPVLVAYDKMLGRGIPDDHDMVGKSIPVSRVSTTTIVPAITQEGFREADLEQAANGDIICVMRSGGRNPVPEAMLFPTPLYCSRSSDNGHSWTPPEQIADRGVCPNLVTLQNGIIVCTYSRPGNWLIFSTDNGTTWTGAFQFGTSGSYNYILEVAPDTIQVYHEVGDNDDRELYGTFFTVNKR